MRTEGQIHHQLSQVRFRHLKRELRTGLSRKPENCSHNVSVEDDSIRVRLCVLPEDGCQYTVCDSTKGGLERAAKCPFFQCVNTKESIRKDFDSFLESSSRAEIASRYPDMAALLWVLDTTSFSDPPTLSTYRYQMWLPGPSLMASDNPPKRGFEWGLSQDGDGIWLIRT